MPNLEILTDPTTAVIFEASPLGLGHLRVTDALYHGLPKTASPILFGTQAPRSSTLYRFASVHQSARTVLEMLQLPPLDRPVAAIGRTLLRHQTKHVHESLKRILSERFTVPQTVLLVATHAVHAHPLGAIKAKLSKEMGIKIFLVVQVTDDSPQAIWYVPDADIIVVPSEYTKTKLEEYGKKARLPKVKMVVCAYPVSPLLTEVLSGGKLAQKKAQLEPRTQNKIHVSVPISGAAVGTTFAQTFIQTLHEQSDLYRFHVVIHEAGFTQRFMQTMTDLSYVNLVASTHERGTIDNYEKVFQKETIALELTKPSEQAFKVLATPLQKGGAIMLFSKPVGGQEYDNVRFLQTHGLVPSLHLNKTLWQKAHYDAAISSEILTLAMHWRGVLLPEDPSIAAVFTHWCHKQGIFAAMMHYVQASSKPEIQSNGVEQFWLTAAELITKEG